MAVRFDNNADVLSRTTNLPATTAFTVMGWVRSETDDGTIHSCFMLGGSSGDSYIEAGVDHVASPSRFFVWNGAAAVNGTGVSVSAGTWYHLALVGKGGAAGDHLVYVNGVLEVTSSGTPIATSAILKLGHNNFSDRINGRIGNCQVYDVALTAAEIAQEMMRFHPYRLANLNAWYPLLTVADDEIDYSGNARTLTVAGTLTTEADPPIPWGPRPPRYAYEPDAAQTAGAILLEDGASRIVLEDAGGNLLKEPAGGGISVAIGQASETDSSQAVDWNPMRRLVAQASETDAAQALGRLKTSAVGQAAETDSAQLVDWNPMRRLVLQAGETDTATAVAWAPKRRLVNVAAESDSAQAVSVNPIRRLIGAASEADSARPVSSRKALAVGQAAETDSAQVVVLGGGTSVVVNQASEADSARPVTWAPKVRVVGQAAETNTAQAVDSNPARRLLGQAVEADAAQALAHSKVRAVAGAVEADSARPVTSLRTVGLGLAAESDSAGQLSRSKSRTLGLASEADAALAVNAVNGPLFPLGSARDRIAVHLGPHTLVRALVPETAAASTTTREAACTAPATEARMTGSSEARLVEG